MWLPSVYCCWSVSTVSTNLTASILMKRIWKLMQFSSTRGSSKMSFKGNLFITDSYQMSKQWYCFKIMGYKNVFYFIMVHWLSSYSLILSVWLALSNIISKVNLQDFSVFLIISKNLMLINQRMRKIIPQLLLFSVCGKWDLAVNI